MPILRFPLPPQISSEKWTRYVLLRKQLDAISRLREEPGAPSVTIDWAVAEGDNPAEMIAIIASDDEGTPQGYHLVALATPPSDRVNHWPLGDVLERLLHSTRLSLLLVHPPRQP